MEEKEVFSFSKEREKGERSKERKKEREKGERSRERKERKKKKRERDAELTYSNLPSFFSFFLQRTQFLRK